jgi:hypothetical protein
MSIKAMNWAWTIRLEPCPKLVLLALADIADDNGRAWPSVRHLADKCGVSGRTIQRVLRDLSGKSIPGSTPLITITDRHEKNRRQTSSMYSLSLPGGEGDKLSPSPARAKLAGHREGDNNVGGRVTMPCRGGRDTARSPQEPPPSPSIKSSLNQQQPRADLRWPSGISAHDRKEIEGQLVLFDLQKQQELLDSLSSVMADGNLRSTPARYFAGAVRRQLNQDRVKSIVSSAAKHLRSD